MKNILKQLLEKNDMSSEEVSAKNAMTNKVKMSMPIHITLNEKTNTQVYVCGGPHLIKELRAKELLDKFLVHGFPDWNSNYSSEQIFSLLKNAKEYLQQTMIFDIGDSYNSSWNRVNYNNIRPLSDRQIHCSNLVIKYLNLKNYTLALHELSDCIDDYNKANTDNRIISVNEYVLYNQLIDIFLMMLESEDEMQNQLRKIQELESAENQLNIKCNNISNNSISKRELMAILLGFQRKENDIRFDVWNDKNTNKWKVVTGYCQLCGGADKYIEFDTEEAARTYASILTVLNLTPTSFTCRECAAEYRNSQV